MRFNLTAIIFASIAGAVLCLHGMASVAAADNWPQWRGPDGTGVANATNLPHEWSREQNIAWRTELPGPAGSTPIVSDGRIFVTTSAGPELRLQAYAVDSGELVWERTVSNGNQSVRGDEGNYASPSPVTDGERVVALMGDGELACYTADGDPVWRVNLQQRYGQFQIQFGYTSTPVMHAGRLFLQMIHGDGDASTKEARVICLDVATGDEVWSVGRETGATMECEHAYTSPLIYGEGDSAELLTHGADFLIAYDLADGRERWRLGGMNPPGNYHPTFRFVASPGIGPNLVVVPTAKKGPVFGVRPGGSGDVTGTDQVVWNMPRNTPDVPSPLVHEGLVYLCGENGALACIEAASGRPIYRKRLIADRHRASPVLADGKLYLTSRNGVVSVVRTGREFELLAKNEMGEEISASPAIVGDTIFLRTFDALYAIKQQ